MGGPFDWGKDSGGSVLPRHIERMNAGTRPPKMKQSGEGSNLPWGGQPKEKNKAYMSGPPKDKGSMLNKLGERGGSGVGVVKGGKALQGHSRTISNKSQKAVGKKGK